MRVAGDVLSGVHAVGLLRELKDEVRSSAARARVMDGCVVFLFNLVLDSDRTKPAIALVLRAASLSATASRIAKAPTIVPSS
jgi:hypothetical protein